MTKQQRISGRTDTESARLSEHYKQSLASIAEDARELGEGTYGFLVAMIRSLILWRAEETEALIIKRLDHVEKRLTELLRDKA